MTRQEHLLNHLSEECLEVAQRVSKALRFGLDEIQKEQLFTNRQRISQELNDLFGVLSLLYKEGILIKPTLVQSNIEQLKKQQKVEFYMQYSKKLGTLCEPYDS